MVGLLRAVMNPVFEIGGRFRGVKRWKALRVTFFRLRGLESYAGEFFFFWARGRPVTGFVCDHFCICVAFLTVLARLENGFVRMWTLEKLCGAMRQQCPDDIKLNALLRGVHYRCRCCHSPSSHSILNTCIYLSLGFFNIFSDHIAWCLWTAHYLCQLIAFPLQFGIIHLWFYRWWDQWTCQQLVCWLKYQIKVNNEVNLS